MTFEPSNSAWVEKYRPKKIDELVGSFKDEIKIYLKNPNSMQHLLLSSQTPGTGKTALAKIIIKELDSDNLVMNSSNDRKIESIREKVSDFVMTKSSKQNKKRIVFLDEADGLTPAAQDALLNLMETYSSNALFILTCNNITKINDALQSRCAKIEFSKPDKNEIKDFLIKICNNEKLPYDDDGLNQLIDINYPSIRNCVQKLQQIKIQNKEVVVENDLESDESYQKLWTSIAEKKDWKTAKNTILEQNIDVRSLNKFFWYKAVESTNIRIIQVTASNEEKFVRNCDERVIFITSLLQMVK